MKFGKNHLINPTGNHTQIMNQACMYKSSNIQITSAQAMVPFDHDTGVVINTGTVAKTPKTNAEHHST